MRIAWGNISIQRKWTTSKFGVLALLFIFALAFAAVGMIAIQENAYRYDERLWSYLYKLNQDTIRFQSGVVRGTSTPEAIHQSFIRALQEGDIEKAALLIESDTREEKKRKLYVAQENGELSILITYLSNMILRYKDDSIASYEIKEGVEGHIPGYDGAYIILRRDQNGEWKTDGF